MPLTTIIPTEFREEHSIGMDRFLTTGKVHVVGKNINLPALHKNGEIIEISLVIQHLPLGEHSFFIGVIAITS